MGLRGEIKRDTQLIMLSVLILSIVTLSVSYSAFFSVQSQSTIQKIETGTLDVFIDTTNSTAMGTGDLFPTQLSDLPTSSTSVSDGSYATLILNNNGTLDGDFSVSVSYDTDNLPNGKTTDDLIGFEHLNVGIYDVDNSKWINFSNTQGQEAYYANFGSLTPSETNVYPILRDIITTTKKTRTFRVYIWLSENVPTTEIGKLVYLKLNVKSVPIEGQLES